MRIRIKMKSLLVYAAYAAAVICLNYAAEGAPLALGLCFAMLMCGADIIAVPLIYALAATISLDWIVILLAAFEGAFACAVTAIYRHARKKVRYEYIIYMAIALAPFIAFSPWKGIDSLYFTDNVYIIKSVAAGAAIVFSLFCTGGVYALFYRLCRSRLRSEELICLTAVFTVTGIGFYNICGLYPTLALCAGLTVFAARLFKDPAAIAAGCALGLPTAFACLTTEYIAVLTLLAAICLLLCGTGRGAPSAAAAICGGAYFYFKGAFTGDIVWAAIYGVLLFICCTVPALPSDRALSNLLSALRVKKHVPEIYERRVREGASRQLFKTARVFKEIECAFKSLDSATDDEAMKRRMLEEIKTGLCSNCARRDECKRTDVYEGFARLFHSGCIKGRVSLVDLPAEITTACTRPAEVISAVNGAITRLKKLTAEAESAQSGRQLLANQARGIADVLKAAAVDMERSGKNCAESEKEVENVLASAGICCTEVKICGDEDGEVYVTATGDHKAAAIAGGLERTLKKRFILKEKTMCGSDRACYVFTTPPLYDAAFGVAYAVKDGERASGDTHSVIKINEHSFLAALCDGMGSGEFAKQVSSTTISLIEAFFRAEMPCETVLETINRLMCFNRDESFTCIDIAAIDLNTLSAGFIKIGSPAGIILKRDGIKILESASLPLGILECIHPTIYSEQLEEGDIVVFMSDGITSAFPSATDLYAFFEKLKPLNPQSLADAILAAAKKAAGGKCPDDMTVVAARIFAPATES